MPNDPSRTARDRARNRTTPRQSRRAQLAAGRRVGAQNARINARAGRGRAGRRGLLPGVAARGGRPIF